MRSKCLAILETLLPGAAGVRRKVDFGPELDPGRDETLSLTGLRTDDFVRLIFGPGSGPESRPVGVGLILSDLTVVSEVAVNRDFFSGEGRRDGS